MGAIDRPPMVIRGVVGLVKWSYYNAAAINGYTVTRRTGGATWRLRGNVIASDSFKLSQRPLVFVAPYRVGKQQREWRWPVQEYSITGPGKLDALLGPCDGEVGGLQI